MPMAVSHWLFHPARYAQAPSISFSNLTGFTHFTKPEYLFREAGVRRATGATIHKDKVHVPSVNSILPDFGERIEIYEQSVATTHSRLIARDVRDVFRPFSGYLR